MIILWKQGKHQRYENRRLGFIEFVHVQCYGAKLPTPSSTGFRGTLFSNWLRMSPMSPKYQKIYDMHYDDGGVCVCGGGEGGLRPPHSSNTSCSEDKISCEWRFSGSKEHTKETKIADSVLLSLFMCSNVMGQHCPRPRAPASAELNFQTDLE